MSVLLTLRKQFKRYTGNDSRDKYMLLDDCSDLFSSIKDGDFEHAKFLMTGAKHVNFKDSSKTTPLILVCKCGHACNEEEIFPFVQYLLDKGATIFKHDNHGKTAMNYAKENGLEKVYKLLKDTAKALQRERMQEVFGF